MTRLPSPSTARTLTVGTLIAGLVALTPAAGAARPVQASANHEVTQQNLQFNPFELAVAAGDTVSWTNRETDQTIHSVVQRGGSEINSPDIAPGDAFEWTFQEAGSYDIVCRFHPDMFMTVQVGAAPAAPAAQHGGHDNERDAHAESARRSTPAAPPGPPESTIPGVAGLPLGTVPAQQRAG